MIEILEINVKLDDDGHVILQKLARFSDGSTQWTNEDKSINPDTGRRDNEGCAREDRLVQAVAVQKKRPVREIYNRLGRGDVIDIMFK